jgi:hypothetical protein
MQTETNSLLCTDFMQFLYYIRRMGFTDYQIFLCAQPALSFQIRGKLLGQAVIRQCGGSHLKYMAAVSRGLQRDRTIT